MSNEHLALTPLSVFRTLCAVLAATLLVNAAASRADTVIENVRGLTMDAAGEPIRFEALWFDDEGRVVATLRDGERPDRDGVRRIDGNGRVLVPGFVDAHVHVMGLGFAELTLDLSDTRSLEQALDRIRAFAEANPGRPWILGRGWNQEAWGLGRFPTAAELDQAVRDRPVYLARVDGHAGWANSLALSAAGITAETEAPPGGRIERIAQTGAPAGVLVDAAEVLMQRAVPEPRPVERDLALSAAQARLHARGITAVADMGTSIEDWQAFRRAGDAGSLTLRIMAYASGVEEMELIAGPGPTPWLYEDRLRLNGVKLYLDGALGSRGAWLKEPYSDDPENDGLPLMTSAELRNRLVIAAKGNFQPAVHAIGDAANSETLAAIETLAESFPGDRRWRIEHAQKVDPADIPRFARNGIVASMQPLHQSSDRLMAEARLGTDRLAGAYAWASIAEAGARLALGSDAPVEPADVLAGMAVAISRTGADGEPAGGWQPHEALTAQQAFSGFTSDAAHAGFAEGRFGRLLPGEWADFVLLDTDPLRASPDELRDGTILSTWVAGREVYRAAGGF
jgi:predicted amidohydrolase YtcJ